MNILQQHKKTILDSGYKYISLYRGSERICAWNNVGKIDEKLIEIETRLNNNPPGVYVIKARNSTSEKAPDQFVINTNTPQQQDQPPRMAYQDQPSEKLLENQRILDLTVKNAELEMQNRYLLAEIEDLKAEIAELEAIGPPVPELSEQTPPPPSLMESAKDFLGSLMEFGAPLLDQHFALKKQQLEIERLKYGARQTAPNTRPPAADQNIQIRKIGEWVETYKDQPEIYDALHEISANSKTVQDFLIYLQQFNPDLHAELSNQI